MVHTDVITSRNNPLIKHISSLQNKKSRNEFREFIAEGYKLTVEAILSDVDIVSIVISENKRDEYLPKILELLEEKGREIDIFIIGEGAFEKISTEKSPQGIITVLKYLDFFFNISIISNEAILFSPNEKTVSLYSVRDPSNLGAIIRSAVAFGIDHIVLSEDCADVYNPKTVRAAMGCLFKVKVSIVSDFNAFVNSALACGRRVFAAELTGSAVSLCSLTIEPTDIFIIGNEGHGIPNEVSSVCTDSVFIPISPGAESLNASVAASILLWEISKVR